MFQLPLHLLQIIIWVIVYQQDYQVVAVHANSAAVDYRTFADDRKTNSIPAVLRSFAW